MDIGAPELIIVLIIVVILFGPSRLAGLGGEIGRSIREFREGLQGDQKKADPGDQEKGGSSPAEQTLPEADEVAGDHSKTD
jgi:sec-independent protein translocase protein TatA